MNKSIEKMNESLAEIKKINSQNLSLNFIYERFTKTNYRGIHGVQHNRYDSKKMYGILTVIKDSFILHKIDWIELPKGDEIKNFKLGDFPQYEEIVNNINLNGFGGTANTLKKNYFPDWERAGIIIRKTDPKSKKIHFKLSEEILNTTSEYWEKKDLFKKTILTLLDPYLSPLYNVCSNLPDLLMTKLEFLLFYTFIENESESKIIQLICSWRKLTNLQQQSVEMNLKEYMNPKKWSKFNKKEKKDWGNFKNETDDIFQKLKDGCILFVNDEIISFTPVAKKEITKIKRNNTSLYDEYFKKNNVEKSDEFEMDHIVRFSILYKNPEAIGYIENYLNLLYINAGKHSAKTKGGSFHQIIEYLNEHDYIDLIHDNVNKDNIKLIIGKDVLIKRELIQDYIDHNKKTLSFLNENQ